MTATTKTKDWMTRPTGQSNESSAPRRPKDETTYFIWGRGPDGERVDSYYIPQIERDRNER